MSGFDRWTDRTADLMSLSDVHRWTVVRTMRSQNVAEHSFGVAVIAWELALRVGISDPISIVGTILWAIQHDAPESLTGDIDGKFKRENPEVRQAIDKAERRHFYWYDEAKSSLPDPIYWIVKIADKIEAIWFIRMWGVGGRADDVTRENIVILHRDIVPMAATAIGFDRDLLDNIVRHILNHSTADVNSIQLRRFRTEADVKIGEPPAAFDTRRMQDVKGDL